MWTFRITFRLKRKLIKLGLLRIQYVERSTIRISYVLYWIHLRCVHLGVFYSLRIIVNDKKKRNSCSLEKNCTKGMRLNYGMCWFFVTRLAETIWRDRNIKLHVSFYNFIVPRSWMFNIIY